MKCMRGKDPDCKVILSGAGGGCCGESTNYGFSAFHLTDDGKMLSYTNPIPIHHTECKWEGLGNGDFKKYKLDNDVLKGEFEYN